MWDGANTELGGLTDIVLHTVNLTGSVEWNVTSDVLSALSEGANKVRFVVKRELENKGGHAEYHSREGAEAAGDLALAPRLLLNP